MLKVKDLSLRKSYLSGLLANLSETFSNLLDGPSFLKFWDELLLNIPSKYLRWLITAWAADRATVWKYFIL